MTSEITLKFIFLVLIALAVSLEVVGDILFKKWSLDSRNVFLYVGLLIYFTGQNRIKNFYSHNSAGVYKNGRNLLQIFMV